MVHFRALYLWCCGGQHGSEDVGNPELSFPGDNHSSAQQDQGISGVQIDRSADDTSLSAVVLKEKDMSTAPKLNLISIESPALPQGTVLHINAFGLEGSARAKKDCVTYIGAEDSKRNDFAIPQDLTLGSRHLMIKYNPATRKYYLRDLGDGTGTFVRIDIPVLLKNGYIISFGESHMVVDLASENCQCAPYRLTVRFLDGPKANESFSYVPSDKPISIGRMADCSIRFEDNSLSRCQCSLLFVEDMGWFVRDGDGEKKHSTNGTWLFVDELFEINNNMVFKAGQTLFQAQYEEACC